MLPRPFYQSASVMKLGEPPKDESVAFVSRRFATRQIGIEEELAVEIVDTAENIPYYIQRLGYFAFEAVASDERDAVRYQIIPKNKWLMSKFLS